MPRKFNQIYPPKIFIVKKPSGQSSADVVNYFKRNLPKGFGKIGHLGTLDPFASGVLLIATGGASRLADYFHKYCPKTYVAKGLFGQATNTGDLTGEVVETSNQKICKGELEEVLKKFLGLYSQVPHSFSATKHNGKPLYEYSREGIFIEKEPVERFIYDLELDDLEGPMLKFISTVSSGTYIRTLFEDIAKKVSSCGHLIELERTSIGRKIKLSDSLEEEHWPVRGEHFDMDIGKCPSELLEFSRFNLNCDNCTLYLNGGRIKASGLNDQYYWVFSPSGKVVGLGELVEGELRPKVNLPRININK